MDTRERERTDLVGSDLASALSSASDHARSNGAAICAQASSFPVDAEATIYRPAKSAMTSGRAGTRHWVLEFEPHSPLFIEPLMGWTASTDPLQQVKLRFPSREAAIAYAQRQGLRFTVREPHQSRHPIRRYADNFPADPVPPPAHVGQDRAGTAITEEGPIRDKPSRRDKLRDAFALPKTLANRVSANAPYDRGDVSSTAVDVTLAA